MCAIRDLSVKITDGIFMFKRRGIGNAVSYTHLDVYKRQVQMWDVDTIQELIDDISDNMAKEDAQYFIKYVDSEPVGFAECQLRYDYVEGTDSSPVGYLEGIFVKEEFRHRGFAKEILTECEKWTKEKGCTEFASDCELDNEDSLHFHMAMGFIEAGRIICFKKEL